MGPTRGCAQLDRLWGDLELRQPGRPAQTAGAEGWQLGGVAEALGQVGDAAALAGCAGEPGRLRGTGQVAACFPSFAGDVQCCGKVAVQACLSTSKGRI